MAYDIIVGRDEADKVRFGEEGLIYLGKLFVKMGQTSSLSNQILMDVARSHVVLVAGKRGSGKSYSLSVIAEEISMLPEEVRKNLSCIIFDTMGIFWTMVYENEKEEGLLRKWDLSPKKLPVKVFVPLGHADEYERKGIPVTDKFAIRPDELTPADWCLTFDIGLTEPAGILIERVISELREKNETFSMDDIVHNVKSEEKAEKSARDLAENLFIGAKTWGIFSEKGTSMKKLAEAGKTTVLDLSPYSAIGSYNVRGLVISLVSRKLFAERMKLRKEEEVQAVRHGLDYLYYKEEREMPMVWLMIDEAHEFLPRVGKTPATDALIQLLREGRQPGVSLVLATQQPGEIHRDVMTQSDIIISHRVTAQPDVFALNKIMQSYLLEDIQTHLNNLPSLKGSALILDDNSERIYPMRVRPKFTWHGGEAPTALKVAKRL